MATTGGGNLSRDCIECSLRALLEKKDGELAKLRVRLSSLKGSNFHIMVLSLKLVLSFFFF